MPDPVNEVAFERAAEILEVSLDQLEQLLDTGVLRGYRRGDDIVFLRRDLAGFITSTSSSSGKALLKAGRPQREDGPSPSGAPKRKRGSRGSMSMDELKKAAMGQAGPGDGMVSLKQQAVERGMIAPSQEGGPRTPSPSPTPPAVPSATTGMPSAEEPSPSAGPSPFAGMAVLQEEPPAADLDTERLASENESLKARLQAAEEVLNDLQSRCERLTQIESTHQTLTNQLKMLQTALVEAEAKAAAYEDMDSVDSDDRRWGAPDPEEKLIAMKRETAEMRGELAGIKRRTEDAEKDVRRFKAERDELEMKLRAAGESRGGGDSARVAELEKELETLTAERDMLAIEAEVAKELKGEIERASELEEKLNTQREVIEAAQERLEQLESERDEVQKKFRELEEKASLAESSEAELGELSGRLNAVEDELKGETEKVTRAEARISALRAERDGLIEELENRDDEIAGLRAETQKGKAVLEGVEKLKAELEKAKEKQEAAELEAHSARAEVTLKDQLIEQHKLEEREQSDLEGESTGLREKLAEAEGKGKQAEARMTAIRAERDGLTAELAKVQGAVDEIRGQAERASSLLGENRALKRDLEAARERAAELESSLEMNTTDREKLAAELKEATSKAEDLGRRLQSQERDLGSIAERVEAAPVDDRLRRELEALRGEIANQMKELGQVRAQGEAARSRRSRSAEEIAKKGRMRPASRRGALAALPGGKPANLGRFAIGEEIGRSRSGTLYRSTLPPSDKPVDVLVLPPELTRDRNFLERFWREMRIVSELDHENLIGVIDVGESEGVQYVTYEHFDAESLAELLRKEGTLPPERALEITRGVAAGLVAATKNEIVHGDLKPENVMVCSGDKVKLAGLGLARGADDDATSLNERGRIEHYAAPEQILGRGRDARSDVYSVGALFFKMLTGKAPLEAGSISEAKGLVELSELARPGELTELSSGLRGVLEKTLAEDPEERYQSLANLATALKRVKP